MVWMCGSQAADSCSSVAAAPIVGSVCMDMSMIDVTGTDVAPGDEVVIVGEQGEESLGVRETAAAIGTIPYELLCRVGSRIQRVYGDCHG
jgi:alanine racemase